MRSPSLRRPVLLMAALLASAAPIACSIAVRRDFAAIPPGQIGFDDMCSLQEYFDTLEAKGASPPTVVSSLDLEGQSGDRAIHGGSARFAFQGDFQLKHLRRILNENWRRLPEQIEGAPRIDVEVKWAERAGVRRVVTDQDAEVMVERESWNLPYQVCLSELLYGEPLYRQRRIMWGLPLPSTAPGPSRSATTVTMTASPPPPAMETDGGAADGGEPDGQH
jgi:hypothetical protein